MVTRLLAKESKGEMKTFVTSGSEHYLYNVGRIHKTPVVHFIQGTTGSDSPKASRDVLEEALKIFDPRLVVSLGVAFGIDSKTQELGDVLVSREACAYGDYIKISNMKYTLKNRDLYETDDLLVTVWEHLVIGNDFPAADADEGKQSFKWFFEPMLSGPIVLSDPQIKMSLVDAAARIGCNVSGGEMEGYGMYHFCRKNHLPCVIIKGICDWGASKNSWEEILDELETESEERDQYSNDLVKDCVQAMATENAFRAMKYLLSKTESVLPPTGGGEKAFVLNGEASKSAVKYITSYVKKDRMFLLGVIICIAVIAAWVFVWPYICMYYEAPPGLRVFFVILFCGIMAVVSRGLYLKRKEERCFPKLEGIGLPYIETTALNFEKFNCALSATSSFIRMLEEHEKNLVGEPVMQVTAIWQNRRKNMQCAYNKYRMDIGSEKIFTMEFEKVEDNRKYKIYPIQADTLQIMYQIFGCGFFHVIRKSPVKGVYREYVFRETVTGYQMMCRKQYSVAEC
ncbi:MAG: hypothetical protein LUG99_10785 [Lachnospiraceae bacterium]|nr:hypothetical protein [Lachnospiraceae bacterium]